MVPANSDDAHAPRADNAAVLAVRHAPLDLVLIGPDDALAAVSRRAERTLKLGGTTQDPHGTPFLDLFHIDDRAEVADLLRHARGQPNTEVRRRVRLLRSDGSQPRATIAAEAVDEEPLTDFVIARLEPPPPITPGDHWRSEDLTEWQLGIHELISAGAAPEQVFDAICRMVDHYVGGVCVLAVHSNEADEWKLSVQAALGADPILGASVSCARPQTILDQMGLVTLAIGDDVPGEPDELFESFRPLLGNKVAQAWRVAIISPSDARTLGQIYCLIGETRDSRALDREVLRISSRLAGLSIERQRDERWLTDQLLFDPLTGLAKRSLLADRVEQAIRRHDEPSDVAAVFIQVVEFHLVNSMFGHRIGDEVLRECAHRLIEIAGDEAVARFGGDDFVVVVERGDPADTANLLMNRLTAPVDTADGERVHIQARIGIATAGPDDTGDTLLRNAHAAMRWSRQPGSGSIVAYDPAIRRRSIEQLTLRGDLYRCVGRGELRVHFQPKVDMATGAICGAEALLRWHHPTHGLLRPDRFIALAEESDVIVDIGFWVLQQSVRQAAAWRAAGVISDDFLLAVNMSAGQLWSDTFAVEVARVLEEFSWKPSSLSLELTETLLATDFDELLGALTALKSLGVLIAADDFGTGYSALSRLDQLPLDVLKVDKEFVARLKADGTGSVVATGVVNMAKELGLRTCAEGVETATQLQGLQVLKCDWAQGYHIARPLDAEAFSELASTHRVWT